MKMDVLFGSAVNAGLPVALWRLPGGGDRTRAVVELSRMVSRGKIRFEDGQSGFAFGPFVNPGCADTLFVRGDLLYDSATGSLAEGPDVARSAEKKALKDRLCLPAAQTGAAGRAEWHDNPAAPSTQPEKERYCELVGKGIEAIGSGRFHKLVLSRTREASLSAEFDPLRLFGRLAREYPSAFVFLVSIPSVGTWMGATPEILVSLDREGVLSTMALGGTVVIKFEGQPEPVWERKELEEHRFISQYIADCFRKVGVDSLTQNGPCTATAGRLYHLKTDFSAKLGNEEARRVATALVDLLHPTPAVCGIPTDQATAFITGNEGYDREFYTGFLGPVNVDGESHLFVNLRSMQLNGDRAILYSGAGVTIESDPVKEWEETEAKSGTLFKVIGDDAGR
jgi:isochorismate synthase